MSTGNMWEDERMPRILTCANHQVSFNSQKSWCPACMEEELEGAQPNACDHCEIGLPELVERVRPFSGDANLYPHYSVEGWDGVRELMERRDGTVPSPDDLWLCVGCMSELQTNDWENHGWRDVNPNEEERDV